MLFIYTSLLIVSSVSGYKIQTKNVKSYYEAHKCDLSQDLRDEIASYGPIVQDLLDFTVSGPFKGRTYKELENFVDTFGPRPSGSDSLEKAIDYMINITKQEDINSVITEEVQVPQWKRGHESVVMLQPQQKNMAVLGLGFSVSTPPEGITAEVIVVDSFESLDSLAEKDVKGKIVVFDQQFVSYGETVKYRTQGASKAAAKGAVASLVKSITPFSMYTPHTGAQSYTDSSKKIPTAAITVEDADLLKRLYDRQEKIVLEIKMFSELYNKTSRNTLIDLKGMSEPEKLVIVSGHIDSWDVGQGAMDDGGGIMISWAVPVILKQLSLRPKRTIRSILWTAEELGLIGAADYANKHENELDKINFIMESDEGTFNPLGLGVSGPQKTKCIVAEILKLFSSINATQLEEEDRPGSDIVEIISKGVPGAALLNANEKYFWYHHTEADTINVEDPHVLDLCAGFWTAVAYIIADLSIDMPRK